MSTFHDLLHKKGQFVLALGGKSLGKTFLLMKLEQRLRDEALRKVELQAKVFYGTREATKGLHAPDAANPLSKTAHQQQQSAGGIHPRRVVRYDARHDGANLVKGLLKAFSKDSSFFDRYAPVLMGVAKLGDAVVGGFRAGKLVESLLDVKALLDKKPPLEDVVESFIATCEAEGSFPCLIVDEANVAFMAGSEEETARTLAALRLLTEYTKQQRRLNVILAASEYSEPYRLSELPFKSDHFTRTVLVPEVPPKEMRALLMGRWGMGANLATAFMAVWGGHVWAAYHGVSLLASAKETFRAIENPIAFSKDAVRGASLCVQVDGGVYKGHVITGMKKLLEAIAVHGHVPVEMEDDPRVKLISERNVGGVLQQDTVAPGIPRDVWSSTAEDAIVVSTNQAMRMLLAKRLRATGA